MVLLEGVHIMWACGTASLSSGSLQHAPGMPWGDKAHQLQAWRPVVWALGAGLAEATVGPLHLTLQLETAAAVPGSVC